MSDPPRSSSLAPGHDEEDPYEGEDLGSYPDWWRTNIEEYRAYDMRPYRPPRFVDDEIAPKRIDELESELDIDVRFRAINPHEGNEWELVVDSERVATVDRRRIGEGFTRYSITAAEFEELVRDAVG